MGLAARWRRIELLPPVRGRDALPGVYQIADEERRVIYVGQSASDVPNRIRQHLQKKGCVAEQGRFWRMQASRVPQADEAALLADHQQRHGTLPECNKAQPKERDATQRYRERSTSRGRS
jgi:predicted GIY-YIG superfamily endonuclease